MPDFRNPVLFIFLLSILKDLALPKIFNTQYTPVSSPIATLPLSTHWNSQLCSSLHSLWSSYYKLHPLTLLPGPQEIERQTAFVPVVFWASISIGFPGRKLLFFPLGDNCVEKLNWPDLDRGAWLSFSAWARKESGRTERLHLTLPKMTRPMERKESGDLWEFEFLHSDTLSHVLRMISVNLKSCQGCLSCFWQMRILPVKAPDTYSHWTSSFQQGLLP